MIDLTKVHKGMDVMTSDGHRLGTVKEILEQVIFLDGVEPPAGHRNASVPLLWIIETDEAVRLAKSREQIEREWSAGPESSL